MPVYLVAYDSHPKDVPERERAAEAERTNKRRNDLRDQLAKTYPENRKLSESAYAIETQEQASIVGAALWHSLEAQDEFHVLALKGSWNGRAEDRTRVRLQARFP